MAEINTLNKVTSLATSSSSTPSPVESEGKSFAEILKGSIDEGNLLQKESEKALADIATGQVKDLHQAAIAIGKAENSMKLMLEVRNKAISAYKEILRTQI
ncbi:flagellar hook-basal body complex protein FliE [Wolinella succinogenes]|uniref:flagellar hook-basal body complex protein FliE n=1 Tax=Wolinella succinogenes TaxID=844 RepID=UPI0024097B23|nr:flagellar hook-basal body complex protein FliE [Wolinella succinogenes]